VTPSAELADGCLSLVLVRRCAHPAFMLFLLAMAGGRLEAGDMPHVTVLKVAAVQVRAAGWRRGTCRMSRC
jgi:hypothetical protein